jgi:hypothetical protein
VHPEGLEKVRQAREDGVNALEPFVNSEAELVIRLDVGD